MIGAITAEDAVEYLGAVQINCMMHKRDPKGVQEHGSYRGELWVPMTFHFTSYSKGHLGYLFFIVGKSEVNQWVIIL